MLINCPECELMVSDKAYSCPHCGYPFKRSSMQPRKSSKRRKLPNGFGQISEIKGRNLQRPFRVLVPYGKDETGRPRSRLLSPVAYFKTYNDAYEALVEYNRSPYDVDKDATLSSLYDEWLKYQSSKVENPATIRQYRSSFNHLSSLHKYKMSELRTYHLRSAIEGENCSVQLKTKMKALLNMLFDYALEREIVTKNYARELKLSLPQTESTIHKAYTDEEMTILWQNQNINVIAAQLIQCYSGWRPDEILNLRIENINTMDWTMKGGMKTENGRDRLVPIHKTIRPLILLKYKQAVAEGREYLITGIGRSKEPCSYDAYRDAFRTTMKKLNLDHKPHDGRVQFITMAKKYNVDEYAIKYIVGHKIDDLTERVYTKRTIDWLQKEISKIPSGEIFGFEN